jgi:DNA polymerase-3 subunit delta'
LLGDCCEECSSCNLINKSRHPDIHILKCDDAAIKIEQIREIQQNIYLRPYQGRKKVYIINNIEKFTPDAANAFLKTLEEPPKDSVIILTANSMSGILSTVVSRCQKINFCTSSPKAISEELENKFNVDAPFSRYLSMFSSGRLSFALNLKDANFLEFKNNCLDAYIRQNREQESIDHLIEEKSDMNLCLCVVLSWLRDILILRNGGLASDIINQEHYKDLLKSAGKCDSSVLFEAVNFIFNSSLYLEQNINNKLISSILIDKLKGVSLWSS